mgnify:CR=1 FL=1
MSNYVVSISREFGSGGRLIGKKLAASLGIPCYDRTLIQKTAEKSGLSPDFIARAEERARSRFHLNIAPIGIGVPTFTHQGIPVSHQAFFAQADVIRELAAEGPCVIVGRCSDYILGEDPACIKVFIHADMASRIDRCVAEYHIPSDNMESRIIQMDRYVPRDITALAKREAQAFPMHSEPLRPAETPAFDRRPKASPELCGDRAKLKALGRDGVSVNRETIDLRYVEQLADAEQSAALGCCLLYAQKRLLDGKRSLRQVADELETVMDHQGLAALWEEGCAGMALARPRKQEILACFNRYRALAL